MAVSAVLSLAALLLWNSSRSQPTQENQEQSAALPFTSPADLDGAVTKPVVTSTPETSVVFGTVQDAKGSPVASAQVCAIRTPITLPVPTRSCVATGADGQYQLTLSEAIWMLGASGGGFAPSDVGPGRRSGRVELKQGGAERVDFTLLQAGREIRGVVRDALGGSVAGAVVVVGGHPGIKQPGAQTLSDESGGFVLTVPMRRCGIVAYAPGYFPGTAMVDIAADVELVLTPETVIRGAVVRDADSQTVSGALVFGRGSGTETATDENGRFELSLDPNRVSTLVASASAGYAAVELRPRRAGGYDEVELRLESGANLELALMIGPKRETCGEGFVRFEPPLDVLGWVPVSDLPVEVHGLPLGPQLIRVGCRGTLVSEVQIELVEGFQRLAIVLDHAPKLTGRVFVADGSPAAMAQISFHGETTVGDITSLEGKFIADYLPPGAYEIEVRSEQRGEGATATVDTRDGDVDVELQMQPWAPVRGRVVDAEGRAVVGLFLSLAEQPDPKFRGMATSSTDGSFDFPAVRSGPLALFAGGLLLSLGGAHEQEERIEFVHDEASASALELIVEDRSRQVKLRVRDAAGEPLAGVRVTLIREGVSDLDYTVGMQSADLDGEMTFKAVPDGPLAVRWPDGSVELLVGSGEAFNLEWSP